MSEKGLILLNLRRACFWRSCTTVAVSLLTWVRPEQFISRKALFNIYIYIYTYIYIYIGVYIYTYTNTYIHVKMFGCTANVMGPMLGMCCGHLRPWWANVGPFGYVVGQVRVHLDVFFCSNIGPQHNKIVNRFLLGLPTLPLRKVKYYTESGWMYSYIISHISMIHALIYVKNRALQLAALQPVSGSLQFTAGPLSWRRCMGRSTVA